MDKTRDMGELLAWAVVAVCILILGIESALYPYRSHPDRPYQTTHAAPFPMGAFQSAFPATPTSQE